MRSTPGSAQIVRNARAPARRASSGPPAVPPRPRRARSSRPRPLHDCLEQRRLVTELVVERPARHAGGTHDLLGAHRRVPAPGEQRAGWASSRSRVTRDRSTCLFSIQSVCNLVLAVRNLSPPEDVMPEISLPQGTIHYRDEGSGPTLVFIHGALVDGRLWDPVVERLAGRARCIVPDLPLGSHRTAMRPDADLSPHGLAQLIAGVLDALDLHDVTLIGNDTGGALCQLVVARHPERVGRLVLTDCDAFENFPPKAFLGLVWAARAHLLDRGTAAAAATTAPPPAVRVRPAHPAPASRRGARGLGPAVLERRRRAPRRAQAVRRHRPRRAARQRRAAVRVRSPGPARVGGPAIRSSRSSTPAGWRRSSRTPASRRSPTRGRS